jgi:uncharacterized protein (DUF305 family)
MKLTPIWMAGALAILVSATSVTALSAQTAQEHGQMDHALSESAQAYMDAMETMMEGMAGMDMRGEPNADFALMMIPHQQSALDMAVAYLEHGDDPELTKLANEIIAAQQAEIEFLQNWLETSR